MPTPQPEEPWDLVIGRVMAPFHNRGEVRVRPETDFPHRFHHLAQVCVELPGGEERLLQVRRVRLTPKGILLHLHGCDTRDQAASLRGAWIKIRKTMAQPLPEGSYYIHQIIGLHAITDDGRDLGEITEVIRSPAHDVYVTESAMIPALHTVVREINFDQGRMLVSLPPEEQEE